MPTQGNENPSKEFEHRLMIRISKKLHYQLNLLSLKLGIPMSELCRQALKELVASNRKVLEKIDFD
jgi:predicted HicB family RNase H-like nuclease